MKQSAMYLRSLRNFEGLHLRDAIVSNFGQNHCHHYLKSGLGQNNFRILINNASRNLDSSVIQMRLLYVQWNPYR